MAVGILSIGMMLVATMFPLGMHLTAVAAERTIASIAADQAFAKIQLYGVDPSLTSTDKFVDFNDVLPPTILIDSNEFAYPAMEQGGREQYYWSALCRKANSISSDRTVQVIVFVSRKRGTGLTYDNGASEIPVPVSVSVSPSGDELTINGDETLINPSSTIVDNATGQIYRVTDRLDNLITLDRNWQGGPSGTVWTIAPPDSGGANPAIAVFQKIIKF